MPNLPAIILAAGRGRRLGSFTNERPKCLLHVGRRALIEHQLEALESCGIDRVFVVVGYNAAAVRTKLGSRVEYLTNPRHAETNSLYSLWLAREQTRQGFVLLNADVLFDAEILRRLLDSAYPDALAVELRNQFSPEEMKVCLSGDRILAMSKELDPPRAHAENVGVLKFSATGSQVLFARMEKLLAKGAEQQFCPYAFDAIASHHLLHAVSVDGLPWIEIDFVEDLVSAREEIWPAIQLRKARAAAQPSVLAPEVAAANPWTVSGH